MLQLRLLGHFQLTGGDGSAVELPGLRDRALLAFLSLQDRSKSRERLAGLLWPDRPEAQARQSLRQSLSSLRRAGVPILSDGRDLIALGPGMACDAQDFLACCASQRLEDLRQAFSLYEGPLLEDWAGQLDEFEEWLTVERSRIAKLAIETAVKLLRWTAPRPPVSERLFLARKVLDIDAFHEAAHREELRALAEMGLKGEAILSHQGFARRLKDQLGVTPAPETTQLIRQLRGETPASPVLTQGPTVQTTRDRRLRLCVFPLANETGQSANEYLSTGIMTEIATTLSRFHSIEVIAPTSCQSVFRRADPFGEAQRELRADYVLEGHFEADGPSVLTSLRLHHLEDATLLWHWTSDPQEPDIRRLSAQVSHAVASRIDGRIDQFRTEKATRASTSSLTAYDLWLRAQHMLLAWTAEVEAEAEGLLLTALEHDPRLARAHSSLALQFNARPLVSPGYPRETEDRRRALHHARLSVDCDPHDPRSHLAMMWVTLWLCDRSRATRHMQIAHELNPHSADVLMHVALVKAFIGEPDAGISLATEAVSLNPLYPDWYSYFQCVIHVLAGQHDLAMSSGMSVASQFLEVPGWLAVAATSKGDQATATEMAALLRANVRNAWKGEQPWTERSATEWFLSVNRWVDGRERELVMEGLKNSGLI
jgi:DNA-binding SARP family transcriptional activator/Tfp pilus assembly protein PilF